MATPKSGTPKPNTPKPKQQRLMLAGFAVVALATAGVIAAFALQDTAAYFKAPSDLAEGPPGPGETFRLGGLVKAGSVSRSGDGLTLNFVVTDTAAETPVSYRGLVPDLFREGQGVIATGSFSSSGGPFVARELLAKHDENYMPPEVARALEKQPGHPMYKGGYADGAKGESYALKGGGA